MKKHLIVASLTFAPLISHAQDLTDADREAILKRIELAQEQAESNIDRKYRSALSAFSSGMINENSAMELYLKCEEMINFEKKNKKAVDFRDWKNKNGDKFSDTSFRLTLQYQLRWLALSLQATSKNANREKLALEAIKIIDGITADAAKLKPYQSDLNQGVLSSIFAQAYNINGIEIKNWPSAPGQFDEIYDQLILPPLRRSDRIASLKTIWGKRIAQKVDIFEKWNNPEKGGAKSIQQSPEYEKFLTETVPEFQWNAEVDIFKAGDQRGASERMLKHIESNINHKSAEKWIDSFTELLQPEETQSETKEDTSSGETLQ
jgi:hypothetical protein